MILCDADSVAQESEAKSAVIPPDDAPMGRRWLPVAVCVTGGQS